MADIVCMCASAITILLSVYSFGKMRGFREGMELCKEVSEYVELQNKIKKEFKNEN